MRTQAGAEDVEARRLEEDVQREKNWKRWGPYLSERQWGTVREDYSEWGNCWEYFSHDQARSRAYRWGEDGLLGLTDRECRMCFGRRKISPSLIGTSSGGLPGVSIRRREMLPFS